MVLENAVAGGAIIALIAGALVLFLIIFAALYVYLALALQSIGRKMGYERSWFAWIPFLNTAMIFQLGGFHWAWVFLFLGVFIPFVGGIFGVAIAILAIVCFWRIFKKAGYNGALSLLLLVPIARLIMLGILAWEKKEYPKTAKK